MAATLFPAREADPSPHLLRLPARQGAASALEEVRFGLGSTSLRGPLQLDCGTWPLDCGELRQLIELLAERGLRLVGLIGSCPTTLVAAAALGLPWQRPEPTASGAPATVEPVIEGGDQLLVHQGTLRSGDHLQANGTVLLLGDLNPGARISAGRHVLVWGRLRGVAHAGRDGDRQARIVALQLQPLQLRIAEVVARGPQERPADGLAEEARLIKGEIRIEPASAAWPLG